jgi:hypothetical protein
MGVKGVLNICKLELSAGDRQRKRKQKLAVHMLLARPRPATSLSFAWLKAKLHRHAGLIERINHERQHGIARFVTPC